MSSGPFLRAPILSELGIDHGFGTRGSFEAAPARLARAQQVHGVRILEVQAEGQSDEADALFAISPGLAVGVVTADCVPVLLAARRPRPIVVAVHAGWRGSAREIAKSVVEHLQEAQGVWPGEWLAVIGPHIGPCCYEVDAPVRRAIRDEAVFARGERRDHWMLDLGALNQAQLVRAGIPEEQIARVGGCTFCQPENFASYRRDRGSGRMLHYLRVPNSA
ncbi:MAG: peptidoglycan editing factor PgeF [Myxococcales bacterium]|nr:peptidoglycan editing factor PgeF [Myxococcales bacterium]